MNNEQEGVNVGTSSKRLIGIYLGLGTAVAARLLQLRNNVNVPRWIRRRTTSPLIRATSVGIGWFIAIIGWPALLTMRTIIVKNNERHGVDLGVSSRWLTLGPRPVREFKDVDA